MLVIRDQGQSSKAGQSKLAGQYKLNMAAKIINARQATPACRGYAEIWSSGL